jgi:hypothetical protein
VGDFHKFLDDLLKLSKAKVLHLKPARTKLFEKLVRLKFNMEDCQIATLEMQNSGTTNECKLQQLVQGIALLKGKVCVKFLVV